MPATVRWSRSHVWMRRWSSPSQDELGELVGVGLGAEALERSVVARREHPPRGLALRAELAHEHAGPVRRRGEPQPDDRALRPRLLRRVLDVDAAGLRQVEHHAAAVAELEDQVLAAPVDVLERVTDERLRAGHDGLQRRERERVEAGEALAGERGVEPLGQRLHLRELGHVTILPAPLGTSGRAAETDLGSLQRSQATDEVIS